MGAGRVEGTLVVTDVIDDLRRARDATRKLNAVDDRISKAIRYFENLLRVRGIRRVASVKIDDEAELAWSGSKNMGEWRFVIRDGDHVHRLLDASREERAEVFTSGAMTALMDRLLR